MSKAKDMIEAEKLWDDLRAGFLNIEILLRKIIEEKAWIPLGYPTFTAAWSDRMRGVSLASKTAAAVLAYAMLDDGLTVEEVIVQTQGKVNDVVAAKMAQLREQGVPMDVAAVVPISASVTTEDDQHVVRPHRRKNPDPTIRYLHLLFDREYVEGLKKFCETHELDLQNEAATAIRRSFKRKGFSA